MRSLSSTVALLLLFFIAVPALAAPSYTVSPLVIDVEAEGRDIITKSITVTNTGDQPVTVFATVNNISLDAGGTIEEFIPQVMSDRTRSLASWIEISRRGLDLPIGKSVDIPITFRISPTPVPDTYHALIGFGHGRNQDEATKLVESGKAPGAIVNLTIKEEVNEFLKLARFVVDRFVTSGENQAAAYTFRNPGDETVVPKGEIILYDGTGAEVGSVSVNDENTAIPPGGEHTFYARIPAEGLFGKYKAFLSVEYGTRQRASIQDTSFFYVLPLERILVIFSILALFVAIASWYIHRRYLDDEDADDSERLTFHVRDTESESKEHDVNLKQR